MYLLQKLNSFPFWLGFVLCGFYLLFPYLYSLLKTPAGFIWVPVNNEHRLAGDNRYYMAGVREAHLNFFKYKHPCSSEIGGMAIDYTRVSSYRTAALLGFFIKDERIAFLLSFVGAVLVQYVLVFILSFYLFDYSWIALFIATIMLFYYKTFSLLKSRSGLMNIYKYIKLNILNVKNEMIFDKVNDNFRYIIMSVAGIYTWLSLLIIIYSFSNPNAYFFSVLLGLYFIVIPFVYPSTSVFSLFIIVVSISINGIVKNNYDTILIAAFVGLVSLFLLLLLGVLKRIGDIKKSNLEVLSMSHGNDKNYLVSINTIYYLLIKDTFFLVPLVLLIVLTTFSLDKLYFVSVTLFTFVCLKSYGFFSGKRTLIDRFIERGGTHYLIFSIICASLFIVNFFIFDYGIINKMSLFVSLILLILPMIGSCKMAIALQKSKAFYMPKSEWEVYRFVKKNTPSRSNLLAFSFSNLQLLPVYTHANLYVRGAEWLESPDKELKKYFKSLIYINGKADDILTEFKNYFSHSFSSSANFIKDENKLKGFHLINTLIYYPFVKKINNIALVNDDCSNWSKEFINYLNKLAASSADGIPENEVDYILLDKKDFKTNDAIHEIFFKFFENDSYALYKNTTKAL